MKRTIYLVDPAGGGMQQAPGLIVVHHKIMGEINEIEVEAEKVTDPGQLRVTQAALDYLKWDGMRLAFVDHLSGRWWSKDPEDIEANEAALHHGGTIYNIDRAREIACITYPGDNTTLILTREY